MYIINFLVGTIILIIAIRFRVNKTNLFIKKYSKVYEEDEGKFDKGKFIRVLSNIFIIGAGILIIGGILALRSIVPDYFAVMSWGIFVLFAFGGFLYMNTEGRFNESDNED